jgi:hypothetical protein
MVSSRPKWVQNFSSIEVVDIEDEEKVETISGASEVDREGDLLYHKGSEEGRDAESEEDEVEGEDTPTGNKWKTW